MNYFKSTNYTFRERLGFTKDSGRYGELLTARELNDIRGNNGILANVYLPKGEDETTEIDLIFIHATGIYVIESKNYSGWIFGSEKQKTWTQMLNKSTKIKFLNPIMQNKLHLKFLKIILEEFNQISYYSVIAFSQRCELKSVTTTSEDILIGRRENVVSQIRNKIKGLPQILSEKDICTIFEKLNKYTNPDFAVKQKHIDDINKNKAEQETIKQ